MAPTLSKLASLRARDWRDLVAAQIALMRAQLRVRRAPTGTLVKRELVEATDAAGDPVRARQVALAVSRAAEHGLYRPRCLVRAVALQRLLEANGIHGSALRVGVRREGGQFAAHAWIIWRGEVLGDLPEHVASFSEVDDLTVLANR